jgi:hypothetical protein
VFSSPLEPQHIGAFSFASSRPIAAEKLAQSQQEDITLDYSDWPGPPDENGIKGPAVHRREVEYHLNQLRSLNALEALQNKEVAPGQNQETNATLDRPNR